MTTSYYEKDKLLVFKINEEIDECSVKNIRRKADYEIERFIASIQVLAVRDEEGRDVFIDRDNPGEPAVMSFAVPEYLYLLLMRAQMTGFGIHLVGRNSSYSDNAAPTVMVSEELETLIKNKTYIIQNECVDLTVCG